MASTANCSDFIVRSLRSWRQTKRRVFRTSKSHPLPPAPPRNYGVEREERKWKNSRKRARGGDTGERGREKSPIGVERVAGLVARTPPAKRNWLKSAARGFSAAAAAAAAGVQLPILLALLKMNHHGRASFSISKMSLRNGLFCLRSALADNEVGRFKFNA